MTRLQEATNLLIGCKEVISDYWRLEGVKGPVYQRPFSSTYANITRFLERGTKRVEGKLRQMDLEEAIKNEKDGVPHIPREGSKDKKG